MTNQKSPLTIHDVAKAAGVSVSTVSRVLNNKDDVAPKTQAKVEQVIEELGYTSSLAARSMRSRQSNVVGVIITDLSDPFSIELVRGIDQAIHQFNYDLLVYSRGRRTNSSEAAWERQQVTGLNGTITDGIIVVTPTTNQLPDAYPLVTIDPHVEDGSFPAVLSTNRDGALAILEYLIGLGHRRIGFIGGRPELQSSKRRQLGYEVALRRAGIPLDPTLIQPGDYSYESGLASTQTLLKLSDPPTAIFAANDQSAIGAMQAAQQVGLRIPDDLSIAGFDNIPEGAFTAPPLTTVDQSITDMGYKAAQLLIDLIQGNPPESNEFKVPTKLVIRKSCRAVG